jgi:hypothetical protein
MSHAEKNRFLEKKFSEKTLVAPLEKTPKKPSLIKKTPKKDPDWIQRFQKTGVNEASKSQISQWLARVEKAKELKEIIPPSVSLFSRNTLEQEIMYQGLAELGRNLYERLSEKKEDLHKSIFGIDLFFDPSPMPASKKLWVTMAANELVYAHSVEKVEMNLEKALNAMHAKIQNPHLEKVEDVLKTIVEVWKSARPLHLSKTWLEDALYFPEAEKVPDLNQYFSILIPEAHAKIKIRPLQTCNRVDPQEMNHYHQKSKPLLEDSDFEFSGFRPCFDSAPNMWRVIITLQNKNKRNDEDSSSSSLSEEMKTVRKSNGRYAYSVFSFDLPVRTGVFVQRLAMVDMEQARTCFQCPGHCDMLGLDRKKKEPCRFPVHISRHPMKKLFS